MLPKETIVAERLNEARGNGVPFPSSSLAGRFGRLKQPRPDLRHNLVALTLLVPSVPSLVPREESNLSHAVSILFPMFPLFPVAEDMATKRPLPSVKVVPEHAEHWELKESIGQEWEQTGNKTGNTGNRFISSNPPIPPVEPFTLALPIPHPALRPQTPGGTNLVRLCPLRLRLVDAVLQDFRDCCALLNFQPRSNHLFPGVTFVTRLLLIAGQLYQIGCIEPPHAARFESHFGFRPQLVTVTGKSIYINPPTHHGPETSSSSLVPQVRALVDGAGENALAR